MRYLKRIEWPSLVSWALGLLVLAVVVGAVVYYTFQRAADSLIERTQAPIVTMEGGGFNDGEIAIYDAVRRGYCPGDELSWRPVKRIQRDADVRIWRTMRQLLDGDQVHKVDFTEEKMSVIAGDIIRDTVTIIIPFEDENGFPVEPGEYEILSSLHHVGSGLTLARYVVQFTLNEGCPPYRGDGERLGDRVQ